MAYVVMALYSYGLCSYGLYSYGLHGYGLYSYGLHSYGLEASLPPMAVSSVADCFATSRAVVCLGMRARARV